MAGEKKKPKSGSMSPTDIAARRKASQKQSAEAKAAGRSRPPAKPATQPKPPTKSPLQSKSKPARMRAATPEDVNRARPGMRDPKKHPIDLAPKALQDLKKAAGIVALGSNPSSHLLRAGIKKLAGKGPRPAIARAKQIAKKKVQIAQVKKKVTKHNEAITTATSVRRRREYAGRKAVGQGPSQRQGPAQRQGPPQPRPGLKKPKSKGK